MAAFLTIDQLRAHLALALWRDAAPAAPRPTLSSYWILGPNGQLICRWQADTRDPSPPTG